MPFRSGFAVVVAAEKGVFIATFMRAVASLVMCSVTLALVLVTQLVLSAVFGHLLGNVAASSIAVLIVLLWWVLPRAYRARGQP